MRWGMPPPPRTGGPPVTNIRNTSSPHWRGWLSTSEITQKADLRRTFENDAIDAVDGAHSAASKCHRMVALEQTTLRGAVHG
jgi:hypothetical protein